MIYRLATNHNSLAASDAMQLDDAPVPSGEDDPPAVMSVDTTVVTETDKPATAPLAEELPESIASAKDESISVQAQSKSLNGETPADTLIEESTEVQMNSPAQATPMDDDAATATKEDEMPVVSSTEAQVIPETEAPLKEDTADIESSGEPLNPPTDKIDAPVSTKVAHDRDEEEDEDEPSSKRTKTQDSVEDAEQAPPTAEPASTEPANTSLDEPLPVTSTTSQPAPEPAAAQPSFNLQPESREDWGDMTDLQRKSILDGLRNLKKGKHAGAYAKPVDPVALNLPTYTQVIKTPMDLGTIEQKLKANQYPSVADYVADFNVMVQNSITFNGLAHPVAQAGTNLRAQLGAQLKKMPKAGVPAPREANQKAKRTSLPAVTREVPRREPRQSLGNAASPEKQFAPDANGVPLVRRDSTALDRPKRKIQRPPPRELSYPKPKKQKFQAELKFAGEVLTEMERPRYHPFSSAFQNPVDPVALNIPNYNQVIKKPMDVSTIRQKYKEGQYENLKEFEADFRLMFKNCYKFNPVGHVINQNGHQYEEVFEKEMGKKNGRLKVLAPPSARDSSQEDSEEEEDDEEEEEEDEQAKQLRMLNEQLAAIQEQAAKLMQEGASKKAKGKDKKSKPAKVDGKKKKKSSTVAVTPIKPEKKSKTKSKPKAKPLTQKEKEEISNRIFELPTEEISQVADQIKKSMRDRGIEVGDESDMEFNIDDIPEEILRNILTRLRRNAGAPAKQEDDDFDSPARDYGPKNKRSAPLSRADTASQMAAIQHQINTFNGGTAGKC